MGPGERGSSRLLVYTYSGEIVLLVPPDAALLEEPKKRVFKAVVRNGRLVLDEPTDLPEGDVILLPYEPRP